jgi:hypothetical protein
VKKQEQEKVIFIKESDVPLTNTRKQLVRYFLRGKAYTSYADKECISVQCKCTANRSITDLHSIIISRFPKTSLEAVVRIVREFMNEDKSIILVWCTQINKVVIRCINNPTSEWISKTSRNNYYTSKGVDGYSLKDFENIMTEL